MFIGTTTTLDSNETYLSPAKNMDRADTISGTVWAVGGAGTLYVEQSADGVNYDFVDAVSVTASILEVQTITITASGGTYTLSYADATTAPLNFDASAAEIETALNLLPTINGKVTVSGAGPYAVTLDIPGDLGLLIADDDEATGGTVVVTQDTQGVHNGEGFSKISVASYVRLRYVNGADALNEFRLYAKSMSAGDS